MIVSVLKGILIALFVALVFAIVWLAIFGLVAVLAVIKFRAENGDIYLEDNEDDSDKY